MAGTPEPARVKKPAKDKTAEAAQQRQYDTDMQLSAILVRLETIEFNLEKVLKKQKTKLAAFEESMATVQARLEILEQKVEKRAGRLGDEESEGKESKRVGALGSKADALLERFSDQVHGAVGKMHESLQDQLSSMEVLLHVLGTRQETIEEMLEQTRPRRAGPKREGAGR